MNVGYREVCLDHDTGPRHPESAERLRAIRRGLGALHHTSFADPPDVEADLVRRVHDPAYVDEFEAFCAEGGGNWDADTVASEATWDAALASAGLSVWAAEQALGGARGLETPFAVGRPPGHHAVRDDAMGFCFLNNAVLGAEAAIREGADRVAILDWDVHHGNGTADLCRHREDVLVASLHEDGIYPGTGPVESTGVGSGEGYTLNVPMPPGGGTADYCAVIDQIVGPEFDSYGPDVVLVSAGFDAHVDDPISRMNVTTEGYGCLTEHLHRVADDVSAGLGFVLEGGYSIDALTDSIRTVAETMAGYEPTMADSGPSEATQAVIADLQDQGFGSR